MPIKMVQNASPLCIVCGDETQKWKVYSDDALVCQYEIKQEAETKRLLQQTMHLRDQAVNARFFLDRQGSAPRFHFIETKPMFKQGRDQLPELTTYYGYWMNHNTHWAQQD